ncbi:MAG: glutamyl-tRNA reductase [Pseudomonadota bacterium]
MDLVILGLSHHTAPLHVRERFDFSKHASETYLPRLSGLDSVRSGMVLSTCNRVEVYAAGVGEDELIRDAEGFLKTFHKLDEKEVRPYLYTRVNREAVRHLFRVAASLDSLVVGEPQILGQVKEAYFDASALSLTDPFFDRLLQRTFFVAKKIRNETGIAEHAVSVSYAAVELAEKIFGDLTGKQVMILGAGEMAELAARHLKRQGVEEIFFANRSLDHSVELSKEYGGTPIPLAEFQRHLATVDILIVSTAAPHYLVTFNPVEKVMEERKQTPMFIIDISVPRNVDPKVHELENVYLYNIDDLEGVVQENRSVRVREAEKAEAIVEAEVERFFETVERLRVAPVIQKLQEKYEGVRTRELERLKKNLPELPQTHLEEIDRATSYLVKKVLNDPIVFLGAQQSKKNATDLVEMFLRIFRIGKDEEEEE